MRRLVKLFLFMVVAGVVGTVNVDSRVYKYTMKGKTVTITVPDSFIVGYFWSPLSNSHDTYSVVFFPNEKKDGSIFGESTTRLSNQGYSQIDTLIEDSLFRLRKVDDPLTYTYYRVIGNDAGLYGYVDERRQNLFDTIFRTVTVEDMDPNNKYRIDDNFPRFSVEVVRKDSSGIAFRIMP